MIVLLISIIFTLGVFFGAWMPQRKKQFTDGERYLLTRAILDRRDKVEHSRVNDRWSVATDNNSDDAEEYSRLLKVFKTDLW